MSQAKDVVRHSFIVIPERPRDVIESLSHLLIVGASTRAAAQGAVRAGLKPVCADVFLDEDLRAVARVLPVPNYPVDLPAVARLAPAGPWMYTGALENHPQLVARIAEDRPLFGNPGDVLRRIRDPFFVRDVLNGAGVPALDVLPWDRPPASAGWLLKPLRSAGGAGIQAWNAAAAEQVVPQRNQYFQRRERGHSMSALFLATPQTTHLIGLTRQLSGLDAPQRSEFAYCGSVGPIGVPSAIAGQVRRSGELLANACGLRGLFGCDFVTDEQCAWLTEVNPRYTASAEVIEFARGWPLIDWHCRACAAWLRLHDSLTTHHSPLGPAFGACDPTIERALERFASTRHRQAVPCVGKRIVFADADVIAPELRPPAGTGGKDGMPWLADVPPPGQCIRRGHPVCTVLAIASDLPACIAELENRRWAVCSQLVPGGHGT